LSTKGDYWKCTLTPLCAVDGSNELITMGAKLGKFNRTLEVCSTLFDAALQIYQKIIEERYVLGESAFRAPGIVEAA
jgi:hypothetical protein